MKVLSGFLIAFLLSACATGFQPIKRDSLGYRTPAPIPGLEFAYREDVLSVSGNRIYDHKAIHLGLEVMAVKLKNLTDRPFVVKDGLEFHASGDILDLAPAATALKGVRQKTGAYAFYLLMTPIMFTSSTRTCNGYSCDEDVSIFPIGLILGLLLFGFNGGVSAAANSAFEKEVQHNDLYNTVLRPGEEVSGYLVFHGAVMGEMTVKLKGDSLPSVPAPAPTAPPDTANPFQP